MPKLKESVGEPTKTKKYHRDEMVEIERMDLKMF